MTPSPRAVFGIPIQGGSLHDILETLKERAAVVTWIVTANPEILLEAKRSPAYAAVLKQADYLSVDGFGLWFGMRALEHPVERVTGVTLAEALIARAADEGDRVGFLGGAPGVAAEAAAVWKKRFPALETIAEEGGRIAPDGTGDASEEEAVHRLVLEAPKVLLVAFGGGSKQEAWIARRIADLPSVRVVVGVGGAFDFWTGRIRRAPGVLQRLGLEWAWRLIQEPRRWKRILRATVIFPLAFCADQIKHPGAGRKRLAYVASLGLRVLFAAFFLVPALVWYVRGILAQGIGVYRWSIADLVIPFVMVVVLYPVGRFLSRMYRQPDVG